MAVRRSHSVSLLTLVVSLFVLVAQKQGWLASAQRAVVHNQPGLYQVTEFVDGDTIAVNMNGASERIRLIGVDTPETHDPRKPVQCYGLAAAAYTKQLIGLSSVRLEADPLSTNRDRYNRLLRYVYLPDGRLVNAEIIKNGYGFAYLSFPFTKSDEFHNYELEARRQNLGLWKNCEPTEKANGGFTSNTAN